MIAKPYYGSLFKIKSPYIYFFNFFQIKIEMSIYFITFLLSMEDLYEI